MPDIPKHSSWSDAIAQIKQQMLAYEPDDSKIYSDGYQTIDVPLPLTELNPPPSDHDIRCYAATAASEPGWPPCPGEYLVMQHPLMAGGFTTALRKEKVLEEIYDKGFLLPEERFVEASYRHYPYGYDLKRFIVSPRRRTHRPLHLRSQRDHRLQPHLFLVLPDRRLSLDRI